jgi:hypothetical protein
VVLVLPLGLPQQVDLIHRGVHAHARCIMLWG